MEDLFKKLKGIYPMSEELTDYLEMTLEAFELGPKEWLLRKGQVSDRIYFVEKGILRCYYEDEQKNQTTKWFMDEGNVIVAVDSFFNRTPSYEAIQTLEPCMLYGITHDQLEYAFNNFLEFNYHGRILQTQYYVLSDRRVTMFQMLDAAGKYEFTRKLQPGLMDRKSVTARDLSSYLGITEETLSRIKKRYQ